MSSICSIRGKSGARLGSLPVGAAALFPPMNPPAVSTVRERVLILRGPHAALFASQRRVVGAAHRSMRNEDDIDGLSGRLPAAAEIGSEFLPYSVHSLIWALGAQRYGPIPE